MFSTLGSQPIAEVEITFHGEAYKVTAGITVAAALLLITAVFRTTPRSQSDRGPYCMMGICFDCLVKIDGTPNQRACMTFVAEGMQVERQVGATEIGEGVK